MTDYLVVGSGVTGATIARLLADAGRDVLVLERRPIVGGNVCDFMHESGIRIHSHGPHYFRTGSKTLWAFVNRFGSFQPFEARVRTLIDGLLESWPLSTASVERLAGKHWRPAFDGVPRNFEEASLRLMPRTIYEKFVKGYTEKQWGVPATQLEVALASRFPVRDSDDDRLMQHQYQGIPVAGYSRWITRMLDGIPLKINCDYLARRADFPVRHKVFFTGPIDEFFGFKLGRLRYRAMKRVHRVVWAPGFAQPFVQINNPDPTTGPHVRTIEWKHMLPLEIARSIKKSVLTTEEPVTPASPEEYEYPFPDSDNRHLYNRYAALSAEAPNVVFCGRLGEYRYYDMDQAIGKAMKIAARVLAEDHAIAAHHSTAMARNKNVLFRYAGL